RNDRSLPRRAPLHDPVDPRRLVEGAPTRLVAAAAMPCRTSLDTRDAGASRPAHTRGAAARRFPSRPANTVGRVSSSVRGSAPAMTLRRIGCRVRRYAPARADESPAPLGPVIPELAYPDVSAAVDWLVEVLGFIERVRIAPRHRAQLSFGGGSLIVADVGHGRVAQTGERSVMLRVDDVASLCERVRTERRHDPPATARVSVRGAAVH